MNMIRLGVLAIVMLGFAGVVQAELAVHVTGDTVDDAIEDVHADAVRDVVFTLHWEGRVEARDEGTGEQRWVWRFTTEPLFQVGQAGQRWAGTSAHGFDMVADADTIYVTFIQEKDGVSQPVVALDKDTGTLVWWLDPGELALAAGYVAPTPSGPAIDAYGVAIDETDTEPWLYIGTGAGYIFKVSRIDAQPALVDGTLTPLAYKPLFDDVPIIPRPLKTTDSKPYGCSRESRISTLDADHGMFFAARNWGGADKQFNCHHQLATSTNNSIVWGFTEDLRAIDILLPLTDSIEGTPVARPGIRELNVIYDAPNEALDAVLGGEASGSSGYITVLQDMGAGLWSPLLQNATFGAGLVEAFTFKDDDLVEPGPEDGNYTELGPGTAVTGVAVDAEYVYAVTRENITTNFQNPGPSTAWMLKLDRNTLQPATGAQSWSSLDVAGRPRPARSIEPGATASDISLDSDGPAWVGHSPGIPPFGDVGGFFQPRGALLLEVPRDNAPLAIWHLSNGGEFSNGFLPFAYVSDYPNAGEPDLEARIDYRQEVPGQPPGPWYELGEVQQNAVPANSYQQLNNVQLPSAQVMPDSFYRFRVHVEDDSGRDYVDVSDGVLTLDRVAPSLQIQAPIDPSHPQDLVTINTNQPRFEVSLSDSFTGIDDFATGLWIDDMAKGYPYLEYVRENGRVTGFVMDLSKQDGALQHAVPVVLAEGQHTVRVEGWDLAGNFAYKQWVINVDTGIRAPKFTPLTGGWQASARPPMVAQFFEPGIRVQSATLDGVDVLDRVTLFPQHPVQNPDGTQVRIVPPTGLSDVTPHTLEVTVVDAAGNVAGPFQHVVRVDTTAPTMSGLVPEPNVLLGEARPEIAFTMADAGSGVRFDTLRVTLDGFSMADKLPTSSNTVRFRPDAPLMDGVHTVKATARDLAGNPHTELWSFRVDRTQPLLEATFVLPSGQTALKAGDDLLIRAHVTDASPLQSVTLDARALVPALTGNVEMTQVPGQPGVYESIIKVTQTRTKAVEVKIQATDVGGLSSVFTRSLNVDNDAPVVFTDDLPATSVAMFWLTWHNTPSDALAGGSGVAYYNVERQDLGQEWTLVAARVTTTSWQGHYAESQSAPLRFRVIGVDHAGNVGEPSNTVETLAKGDPFAELLVSEVLRAGASARFTATPVDGALLDNTTARVILASQHLQFAKQLDLKGRIFVGEWNLTEVPPGPYRLYFEFDDGAGSVSRAPAQDVTVLAPAESVHQAPLAKDSPGLGGLSLVALLGALGLVARRRMR